MGCGGTVWIMRTHWPSVRQPHVRSVEGCCAACGWERRWNGRASVGLDAALRPHAGPWDGPTVVPVVPIVVVREMVALRVRLGNTGNDMDGAFAWRETRSDHDMRPVMRRRDVI